MLLEIFVLHYYVHGKYLSIIIMLMEIFVNHHYANENICWSSLWLGNIWLSYLSILRSGHKQKKWENNWSFLPGFIHKNVLKKVWGRKKFFIQLFRSQTFSMPFLCINTMKYYTAVLIFSFFSLRHSLLVNLTQGKEI